ncbi:hypothetical protein ACFYO7_28020 [Nocardia salmonicida]|uniref:hypothetical protein n=1 Tax=Nocardia salmonicida TaxID=53431 RepID=UPI003675EA17
MARKGYWEFESGQPWQSFAQNFRGVLSAWKPPLMMRGVGLYLKFQKTADFFEDDDVFDNLDMSDGVVFDVVGFVAGPRLRTVPAKVRMRLTDYGDGTYGEIAFYQLLGGAGKDLGELALRSVRDVDPRVSFK